MDCILYTIYSVTTEPGGEVCMSVVFLLLFLSWHVVLDLKKKSVLLDVFYRIVVVYFQRLLNIVFLSLVSVCVAN